jgi:hypothetical protein
MVDQAVWDYGLDKTNTLHRNITKNHTYPKANVWAREDWKRKSLQPIAESKNKPITILMFMLPSDISWKEKGFVADQMAFQRSTEESWKKQKEK